MDDNPRDEMVSYLLGELTGQEAEEFEQRYLSDQDVFEQLRAAEEDLIEDYLRGYLPSDERTLFERRYLSRPENREKIEFAHALVKSAFPQETRHRLQPVPSPESHPPEADATQERPKPAPSPESPGVPEAPSDAASRIGPTRREPVHTHPSRSTRYVLYSVAAALIFGIAVALCLVAISRLEAQLAAAARQQGRLEQEAGDLRARLQAEQGNNETLAEQLQSVQDQLKSLQQKTPSGSVLSMILKPLMSRGASGSGPEIPLKPGTSELDLKLEVGRFEYQNYRASIRRLTGETVPSPGLLRRSGNFVTIKLPAETLKPGRYVVTLNGIATDGTPTYAAEYAFTLP